MNRACALFLAALLALPLQLVARSAAAREGRLSGAAATLRSVRESYRRLSRPAKLALGALALGAPLAAGLSYHHEVARGAHIPLAFSEVSNVEREAAANGVELPPLQTYLMHENELNMKIFEASNLANEKLRLGGFASKFAQELKIKLEMDGHNYKLPGLLDEMPGLARAARESLRLEAATQALAPARADLAATWRHTYEDHSHMEDHGSYVDDHDDKGRRTGSHWQSNWVSVYDDTDHWYTYSRERGERGSQGLDQALGSVAVKGLALRTTNKTHADGELAADQSRGRVGNGKARLTKAELLQIANTWAQGSTYREHIGRVEQLWTKVLPHDANTWRADKARSQSVSYNNRNAGNSDPGPKEYRTVQQALADSDEFVERAQKIVDPIRFTEANVPVLKAKIHALVEKELHGRGNVNSRKLAAEIMDLTRQLNALNFSGGVDGKEFRGSMVFLWLLIGAAGSGGAGWAAGLGLDRLGERRRR